MRILPAIVLVSLAGLAIAQQGNADGYIDTVLENARNDPEIRGKIDPLVLDDLSFGKGSASGVKVYGLASLSRTGPATISVNGNQITVEAHIGISGVNGDGRWKYRQNRFIKLGGSASAKVDSVNCYIKAVFDGTAAHLDTFAVRGISGLKVTRFTGASVAFNWLAKWIINQVLDRSRGKIRGKIEDAGRDAIAKALQKVDIHKYIPMA